MNPREKLEAEEKKIRIYNIRAGICEVCPKIISYSQAQLAHRIPKSKVNLKKYGKGIIHHPKNLALTCSLECNSKVNINNNPGAIEELLKEIEDGT